MMSDICGIDHRRMLSYGILKSPSGKVPNTVRRANIKALIYGIIKTLRAKVCLDSARKANIE